MSGDVAQTIYTHDASGNAMAVYEYTDDGVNPTCFLTESHIYGGKRLGIYNRNVDMEATYTPPSTETRILGNRSYELSNHLNNVLNVISDRLLTVDGNTDNFTDYYMADVISYCDYTPYGMAMPNRNGMNANYRFSFQGQEKDDEIKGENNSINYKYRMHDPRIGRFFAVDPLAPKYPHNSVYAFSENRVIDGIELEGLEYVNAVVTVDQTGTVLTIAGTPWDSSKPNVHGPLGKGVSYSVFRLNEDGSSSLIHQDFVSRNQELPPGGKLAVALLKGPFGYYYSDYGLYMGGTSLSVYTFSGAKIRPSYELEAIDAVDNAAKLHDKAYDAIDAVGKNSLVNDWGAIEADRMAVAKWQQVLQIGVGGIDPFNGATITSAEYQAASNAVIYFAGLTGNGGVIGAKVSDAANWWYDNYVNSDGKYHDMYYTDTDYYYQKFRSMYMHYDGKEQVWKRKTDMWTKDSEGNWTPIVKK